MTQTTTPKTTKLGSTGPDVFPLALGCMGMGARSFYGDNDEAEGIATIHAMLERGVSLLDTGDFYSIGRNEVLVGKALAGHKRDRAVVSVKFGALRGPDASFLGYDASPRAVKNALAYSLSRLGLDHIDIYRPARLDSQVPIEDTIGAIADMVKAGYVRHIGLSEVGVETIRRAAKVHPIVDLQIEYSLLTRTPEEKIFPVLRELGIATTAYGVLSRGLLSGRKAKSSADFRAHLPRFTGANAESNQRLVEAFAQLARARDVTPAQLAIAWVRAKGMPTSASAPTAPIVPLVGARTPAQLADAIDALAITLTASEVSAIEAAVPASAVAGTRYAAPQMAVLDSEK
ncbi:MAG: aldo/keto reductase [Kofleriaceae bacterium]